MQQPVQHPESPDASLQAAGPLPPTGTRQTAGPGLRLLPPRTHHSAVPVLSPDQLAVLEVPPGSGPVLVAGAPGTGKSTVLVEAAVRRTRRDGLDPERMLILAPGRLAADTLRDRFTARLDRSLSTTPARTWASYAFDLIRRAKAEGILPLPRPPKLLSGPEQDLIIKELLEGHALPGLELPWPEDLGAALQTRGFRQEVRQLFDRIIESGRTAEDLVALARQCNRPDWIPAAALYSEYRDVLDLRMPEAFDPAGIITAARQIFQDAPGFPRRRARPPPADPRGRHPGGEPRGLRIACRHRSRQGRHHHCLAGHRGPGLPRGTPRPRSGAAPSPGRRRSDPGTSALDRASARPGRGRGLAVGGRADLPPVRRAVRTPAGTARTGPDALPGHARRRRGSGPTAPPMAARGQSRPTCCRPRSTNCGTWRSGSSKPS